jgi:uncharacterized protein (TIGR03437 family)
VGAGLYQINMLVPANLSSGDQALTASIGGAQTQSSVFITVQ